MLRQIITIIHNRADIFLRAILKKFTEILVVNSAFNIILTYLVIEVKAIATPLTAPSLSNVTELLIKTNMAEKQMAIKLEITSEMANSEVHSNQVLYRVDKVHYTNVNIILYTYTKST